MLSAPAAAALCRQRGGQDPRNAPAGAGRPLAPGPRLRPGAVRVDPSWSILSESVRVHPDVYESIGPRLRPGAADVRVCLGRSESIRVDPSLEFIRVSAAVKAVRARLGAARGVTWRKWGVEKEDREKEGRREKTWGFPSQYIESTKCS